MATLKGILGRVNAAAATDTVLYTVPSSRHATVKVVYANRAASTSLVRLAVSPSEDSGIQDKHYLAYDFSIAANDAITSVTFMVGAGDVVRVRSNNGNVTFTCTGIEQDA